MADVTLPQLGETVTEGTITQWFKQVGDAVAADEPLFEVSTDKVDTEVPSPVAGVLSEIRVAEGDTVDVGVVVAVVGDAAAAPAPAAEPAAPLPSPPHRSRRLPPPLRRLLPPLRQLLPPLRRSPSRPALRRPAPAPAAAATAGDSRLLSPVVRRLVNEHAIDPDHITGTGPGGRITREDVLDHIDATAPSLARPAAARCPCCRCPRAGSRSSCPCRRRSPLRRSRRPCRPLLPRHRLPLHLRRSRSRRCAPLPLPPLPLLPRRRRCRSPASATPACACRRSVNSPVTTW